MKFVRSLLLLALCAFPLISDAAYDPTNHFSQGARLLIAASTSGQLVAWPGGVGVFGVAGTFNGATVTLQIVMPDGTLFAAGSGTTCTAECISVVYLPKCYVQATITGAGGSTSLSASLGTAQGPQ